MDAINRTGVDGLLNTFGAVSILSNRSGATEIRLYNERVTCDVGAIAAADADGFIYPNRSLGQRSPELRLTSISYYRLISRS